jgi:predicted dehydrogenase
MRHSPALDRRTFLTTSSAAAALALPRAWKPRADELRVALIGCGGRGTGAALQALATDDSVRLVSMADAFSDRLESSLSELQKKRPKQVDVPAERRFVGFDAFERALDSDVDVALLCTPPGFRPAHFAAAVARGRHVFMEKPVAVDAPGVRTVLQAAALAKEKGLKVGVGLQRRHDPMYLETVRRIQEGALGKLVLLRCYWNSSGVWVHPRKSGQTEMEHQMRNWYYFNWLCGDHIVEQHIHNLDVCNWIQRGYPVRAQGQGGRQVRLGPDYGEIYDHHAVEYTYADGTVMLSQSRHIPGCWESVSEHAHGTLGSADVSAGKLEVAGQAPWKWRGEQVDPFQREHDDLFGAIRSGVEYAEAEYGARSTLTAIMGRMATYSGKVVAWEQALASDLSLAPERLAWDALPRSLPDEHGLYPIPAPGSTRAM